MPPLSPALMAGLSEMDMLHVSAARPRFSRVEAGKTLLVQGECCHNVYVLLEGWAFPYQDSANGRRQIINFATSSTVFGLSGTSPLAFGVETLTDCAFSIFERDNLWALLRCTPVLGLNLVKNLAEDEARVFQHITNIGSRSARSRVARLLVELLMRSNELSKAMQGRHITLPLTQSHIANALGLVPETVCRTLTAMREAGVVIVRRRILDVIDIDQLAAEAGVALDREFVGGTQSASSEPQKAMYSKQSRSHQ
jgi:CRP/FNR family transcriptional regulator, anaerobic regulatory protein